ncbi:MAG: DegV family protein [Oscillospiraceae bacterium]|jgi:DegV family protein with EDD domain|nr:DegV family protein [Oscillospiraceae bacterium]
MVKIISDSTADMPRDRAKELGVHILPLTIYFGEQPYTDGVDLTPDEFFDKLSLAKSLPTTSQPSPDDFAQVFEKYIAEGDEIFGIFISSAMSGTYQSACIAAEAFPGKIHLVDSRTTTLALRLLLEETVRLRDKGLSAHEIAEQLEEMKSSFKFYADVEDLKYLKMGGRLSTLSAFVGNVVGVRPILSTVDGRPGPLAMRRGKKAAFEYIYRAIAQSPPDPEHYVVFAHGAVPEKMAEWKETLAPFMNGCEIIDARLGATVGAHVGPGSVGVAYFPKK